MIRPLLLVIDMQNDFLDAWPVSSRESLLRSTQDLVRLIRSHGSPVGWVRQEFEPDLSDAFLDLRSKNMSITIKGTPGCDIAAQLPVAASDPVIVKERYSAFFRTGLDAYQREWRVIIASDCVGSCDQAHHEITLRYLQREIAQAMSNQKIDSVLRTASRDAFTPPAR